MFRVVTLGRQKSSSLASSTRLDQELYLHDDDVMLHSSQHRLPPASPYYAHCVTMHLAITAIRALLSDRRATPLVPVDPQHERAHLLPRTKQEHQVTHSYRPCEPRGPRAYSHTVRRRSAFAGIYGPSKAPTAVPLLVLGRYGRTATRHASRRARHGILTPLGAGSSPLATLRRRAGAGVCIGLDVDSDDAGLVISWVSVPVKCKVRMKVWDQGNSR